MKKIGVGAQGLKTRHGKPVRIYAIDGSSVYPIHGAVFTCGAWEPAIWQEDGRFDIVDKESNNDIILEDDPKPKLVLWWNESGYLLALPENANKPSGGYKRVDLKDLAGWDE